ncbi:MAG: YbaB/EbfC family nucleoid-associated protein [Candidatus Sericytochromatia bacterium]|nr:YbaB/EbfC family nucleoid-associated protein [Candidatus Sericytochromatia bacterium]
MRNLGGGMGDMGKIMKQAQQMQAKLLEAQNELASVEVQGTSGGGLVKITVTGKHEVKSVTIAKEAVDPEDVETLEDLVLAACRDAISKANAVAQGKMNDATGGMPIPGMDKMF